MSLSAVNRSGLAVPAEEAISKVLEFRKKEYGEDYDEAKQREKVTKLETAIRSPDLPADWDAYEPTGGIKLTVSHEEIEALVQKKFDELKEMGILIRRSDYVKQYNPDLFRYPGRNEGEKVELTRIFGAEYIRKNIQHRDDYRVPKFLLVANDDAKTLSIEVYKDKKAVIIRRCDPTEAEIVVENIENSSRNCSIEKHSWMKDFGYCDFADDGNILENSDDGKSYVVDTEWKSLEILSDIKSRALANLEPSLYNMRRYANERFNILHGEPWSKRVVVTLK